jgi:guanylate kinase
VGKGTIKERLLQKMDDIKESISVTTRLPREGETDGKEYFFTGPERFQKMVDSGEFLEYACVYGSMYGTPRQYVLDNLHQGSDILLEIDIQGAMQVKKQMPDGVYIFIEPPSISELAARLSQRGKDSRQSIETRLASCEEEMAQVVNYDYRVVNRNIDEAVSQVQSIIIAERCKVHNMK